MPDLSRIVTGFEKMGGFVWDPRSHRLLLTANGALNELDPLTGQLITIPIPGVQYLMDLDVSPDGRFVLLGEAYADPQPYSYVGPPPTGPIQGYYYRVWLGDGRVETLSYKLSTYEAGAADVAVLSDGKALLSTSLYLDGSNLRIGRADDSTPTLGSVQLGLSSQRLDLTVSDGHRYVLALDAHQSGGPLALYDAQTGQVTKGALGRFPAHEGDFVNPLADISEAAGLVALSTADGRLVVTDLSLHLVRDLSFDFALIPESVQFSPDGRQLLVMQGGTNRVLVFDTHSWNQLGVINLQTTVPREARDHDGALEFSDDGRFLFVDTATGVEVVDMSGSALKLGEGSVQIVRTVVTDVKDVPFGESIQHEDLGFRLWVPPSQWGNIFMLDGMVVVNGGASATGAIVQSGDTRQNFVIFPSGIFRVTASDPNSTAIAYYGPSFDTPSFYNSGLVDVRSEGSAYGVQSWAVSGSYGNWGEVHVSAHSFASGFYLPNLNTPGGNFFNYGNIKVTDDGGPTGGSVGVTIYSFNTRFHNELGASISVDHLSPSVVENRAVVIHGFENERSLSDDYVNAGTIRGDIALEFSFQLTYSQTAYEHVFHNTSTGVLRGTVMLTGRGAVLDNAGLVDGNVVMGYSSEKYDGSGGGRVTGMVTGGEGSDLMIGGPSFDYFQGNQGDDDERGGGGNDWVVGGKDNDRLAGNDGDDVINGNLGNDTVDGGAGADTVRGGQGSDTIQGGAGNDWLSGDLGDDTIAGGAGADTFHGFAGIGLDRIVDFSRAEGDRILLDPGTSYTVQQVGADTVIDITGGGQMVLVGVTLTSLSPGWIAVG